jgi:membrane-bound lytic murein transglycosylase D
MQLKTALPTSLFIGAVLGTIAAVTGTPGSLLNSPISAAPMLVSEVVSSTVSWDIPVVRNEAVQRFITLFEDEQPDRMALYLKRSGRYEGMIRRKLRERGMPEDLLYLSMIESGFNPTAKSVASAVGLWQFMAPTARDYGLRVDSYVDERRDPDKSTDAALRHLQDLYKQFGSWNLAAAAYNSGSGRVGRIMREMTGAERGTDYDFWRIRERLPEETAQYVPLMVAAALIGKEPHKYGMARVERWSPFPIDTVEVPGGTSLEAIGTAVGLQEDEIQALNPQLIRGMTPPDKKVYPVSVPEGRATRLVASLDRLEAEAGARRTAERAAAAKVAAQMRRYKVKNGDNLSSIAKRHGVSVKSLQQTNEMGRKTALKPGQVLRIAP